MDISRPGTAIAVVTDAETRIHRTEIHVFESEALMREWFDSASFVEWEDAWLCYVIVGKGGSVGAELHLHRDGKSDRMQAVVDYWNAKSCTQNVRKLTKDRATKLRARLADCDWPWREAIDMLPIANTSSFKWQPNFDWLIRNDANAYKLAEGTYAASTDKEWAF